MTMAISRLYYSLLYYSIKIEKSSSPITNQPAAIPLLVLAGIFLSHRVVVWANRFSRFVSGFLSNLQYSRIEEQRKKTQESDLHSSDSKPKSLDFGREDVELVMEKLGLFCNPESQLWLNSSKEILGLFDENEPTLNEVKEAFDVFDHNRDGFIDAMELQKTLRNLGLKEGQDLQNCRKLIKRFDKNEDGKIEFSEFVELMEICLC